MRRRPVLLALASVPLLAGCGGSADHTSTSAVPGKGRDAAGCLIVPRPKPHAVPRLAPPRQPLDPAGDYLATVLTNCGTFTIALDVRDSPKTTASFVSLAGRRFYDGLTFHRVAPDFLVQGGDPLGTGFGGPGYQTVERPSTDVEYVRGTVAMARTPTAPSGASGSQFFVVTAEDLTAGGDLTTDYALLGHVASGMDTIDRIASEPARPAGDGMPVHPVVIRTLRIGR